MTLNLLVWSTVITHHWWSWSAMQSTFISTQLFNFLQPFHIASIAKPFIKSIEFCLFGYKYWLKHFAANIIIDLSCSLSKYIQFEVFQNFLRWVVYINTLLSPCSYRLDRNGMLLKFLRILLRVVYFTDRNWIYKTVNCISCSVVCKIVFCSEFLDIPNHTGKVTRKRRRRRTQAITKHY